MAEADGLVITAGAGTGVDSGLPDFQVNVGVQACVSGVAVRF